MVKKIKIHTLTQLKKLKKGTRIRLLRTRKRYVDYSVVSVTKTRIIFDCGALTFPEKNGFESWDDGFIIKKGMTTSIPIILKYEVFK